MSFLFKEFNILKKKVPLIAIIWFALALIAVVSEVLRNSINNYLIFKYVFWHAIEQKSLFAVYPEYVDTNHYGPLFTVVIAPFAVLPDWLGCTLWALANAGVLFYAINRLNISHRNKLIILAISAIEMMTSVHSVQFNPATGAWLILTYVLVEDEEDFWATMLIAAGFLIKLYGIAGLLFFVFSKHKVKFILSFIFWMIVLFCLPMIFSSPSYIIESYKEWMQSLAEKNEKNTSGAVVATFQDISVMGMARRISGDATISSLIFLVPAAALIMVPLVRFKQYVSEKFRLSYLAIVLITVIVFSSSAESATYVIALPGACIWYILHRNNYRTVSAVMLILLFIFTILSPTDLVPRSFRENVVRAYSLKALPCFLIWLWLIADVMFKDFLSPATTKQQV
jgi:hypothetical protein